MDEIWKPAVGFDGYEISNHGRVRSLDRLVKHSNGQIHRARGRMMRVSIGSAGYHQLKMGRRYVSVHRLVLLAFVGPPGPGQEAAHADGNRENPRLDNLRWATRPENHADKRLHGTHLAGEAHVMAKLNEADVLEMRLAASGTTQRALAKTYGVGESEVGRILSGEVWRDVGGPLRPNRVNKKISDDEAVAICRLIGSRPQTAIAEQFGISQAQVSRIASGRR